MGTCQFMQGLISTVRKVGHARSYMYAWIHGVRVGKREVPPKENWGVVAWEKKKKKWMEGRAGTNNRHPSSPELPSPTPHLHPVPCPGEPVTCSLPFGPARVAPGGQADTFGSALLPGSLLTISFAFVFTEIFHS